MINVGDTLSPLRSVQSPPFSCSVPRAAGRYYHACVGGVQYPHIYHEIYFIYKNMFKKGNTKLLI